MLIFFLMPTYLYYLNHCCLNIYKQLIINHKIPILVKLLRINDYDCCVAWQPVTLLYKTGLSHLYEKYAYHNP